MKKLLAMVLALVMTVSLVATANAAKLSDMTDAEAVGSTYEIAVGLCTPHRRASVFRWAASRLQQCRRSRMRKEVVLFLICAMIRAWLSICRCRTCRM